MRNNQRDTAEKVILVHVDLGPEASDAVGGSACTGHSDEFTELARAAGACIVGRLQASRDQPAPRFFLGSGKADELQALVAECGARLVIFDHDLSPAQERNLEKHLQARVLSRTGLILEIFAQRARTHEGKLQVELAQLKHMSARLVRGWSHLDREQGGIGLRGAGEAQLELDQRLLQTRIARVHRRLDAVRRTRAQSRRARRRAELPLVALVGYTNVGKSTLFNGLAKAGVPVANQLFATLDPTLRRLEVGGFGPVVIADTVGFVRQLPHTLVEAFKATLEELSKADLLLHVLDASDPVLEEKRDAVHAVLAEIAALDVPRLEVLNKIDLTDAPEPGFLAAGPGRAPRVRVSAETRSGFTYLEEAIADLLGDTVRLHAQLAPDQGRLRAQCYARGWVEAERTAQDGSPLLALRLPQAALEQLREAGVRLVRPGIEAGISLPRQTQEGFAGPVAACHVHS